MTSESNGERGGDQRDHQEKPTAPVTSAFAKTADKVATLFKHNKKHIPAFASVAAAIFLIFYMGVTVGYMRLGPSVPVRDTIEAIRDVAKSGHAYFLRKPVKHMGPLRFDHVGPGSIDVDRAQPGVTFMVGLYGNSLGARLYDINGALIHEWPINFFKVAPEEMAYPFDALLHGSVLYPNGDIIVNLDGRSLMRVSACGDIIWRNEDRTHHSIDVDDDGNLWAPTAGNIYTDPQIAAGTINFDRFAQFSPQTGERLRTVDVVNSVIEAEAQGLVRVNSMIRYDVMHLNDVEILSAEMADAFPDFEAGDMMLSSRHFNQIWILDGKTDALKWWIVGPTVGQHDPDFQPDGSITVFDNRVVGVARPENNYLGDAGGSRIIKIDPQTKTYDVIYASSEKNNFYSAYRGKHQMLDNGNILITETDAGRAFEATPEGDIVWEFINAWDDDEIGWIMSATRHPQSFGDFASQSCPASAD